MIYREHLLAVAAAELLRRGDVDADLDEVDERLSNLWSSIWQAAVMKQTELRTVSVFSAMLHALGAPAEELERLMPYVAHVMGWEDCDEETSLS